MGIEGKVIIIDDDEEIRELLVFSLKSRNVEIIQAVNGKDGLSKIKENPDCKVVLSDIKMPEMDGLELIEKVRENGYEGAFLIISAHGNMDHITEALKFKCYDFISKPFLPKTIVRALDQAYDASLNDTCMGFNDSSENPDFISKVKP